ncbi:MAG: acyl-CoA dehydrogenase [Tissierellia bacterium]|nr:acyl-CoA dehydrogenase [Tissierellia bacterium]
MDFIIDKQHELLRQLFSDFAVREVEPIAAEIDQTEEPPIENIKKMAKNGFMGVPFPKELGGQGGDYLAYAMLVEELSKKCATTGVIVSAHTSLGCAPIYEHGNDAQKQKYLPDLLSGKKVGAFALTEPNAGTDASGQQTVAVLDGDEYILNGTKIFITNAGFADVFIVFAISDRTAKGTKGISAFIVERGTPGFTIGEPEDKMGIRASSTCELIFEDCRIPKENLLGREGRGFGIAMKTLDGGRIGIAAQALGIAQGAIDASLQYTKERKQFNRRISQFQRTQFELADMQARTEAARLLVYQAADHKQHGLPYGHLAAMAKLVASETASDVTRRAVQLLGGYGYIKDYPLERMMRDSKITEIYEGTSEVMRMVIAGWMGVN